MLGHEVRFKNCYT